MKEKTILLIGFNMIGPDCMNIIMDYYKDCRKIFVRKKI